MIIEISYLTSFIKRMDNYEPFKKNTVIVTYDDLSKMDDEKREREFVLMGKRNTPISSSEIIYDNKEDMFVVKITLNTRVLYDEILNNLMTTLSIILSIFKQPFDSIYDVSFELTPGKYQINNMPSSVTDDEFNKSLTELTDFIRGVLTDEKEVADTITENVEEERESADGETEL